VPVGNGSAVASGFALRGITIHRVINSIATILQ